MDSEPDIIAPIVPAPIATYAPPRRSGGLAWLIILLLAIAVGYVLWRVFMIDQGRDRAAQDTGVQIQQLRTQIEAMARGNEQTKHDSDTLRARLDDSGKVNQSLREQLLGLTERARLLEDAVANLADKRISAHDALLLNEAEMLLALGGERYTLFHDADGSIAAYRLADTAFAAINDAAFSTVRQSVSAEIDALNALQAMNVPAALAQLSGLRESVAQLPLAPRNATEVAAAPDSRWWRVFGQFIRIRTGNDAQAIAARHDGVLARELLTLDLREAESALLARDAAHFASASNAAHASLHDDFNAADAKVAAAIATLTGLQHQSLAPGPPTVLGASLRELRNLRATHALHEESHIEAARVPEPRPPDSNNSGAAQQ